MATYAVLIQCIVCLLSGLFMGEVTVQNGNVVNKFEPTTTEQAARISDIEAVLESKMQQLWSVLNATERGASGSAASVGAAGDRDSEKQSTNSLLVVLLVLHLVGVVVLIVGFIQRHKQQAERFRLKEPNGVRESSPNDDFKFEAVGRALRVEAESGGVRDRVGNRSAARAVTSFENPMYTENGVQNGADFGLDLDDDIYAETDVSSPAPFGSFAAAGVDATYDSASPNSQPTMEANYELAGSSGALHTQLQGQAGGISLDGMSLDGFSDETHLNDDGSGAKDDLDIGSVNF